MSHLSSRLVFIRLLSLALVVSACRPATPAPDQIQTEVAAALSATQAAYTPTPRPPTATFTPAASATPSATYTPAATATPADTATPEPTATPERGTMHSPYPFKQVVSLERSGSEASSSFTVQVVDVIRGAAANSIVRRANMFNDKPAAGLEYVLIKVRITLQSGTLRLAADDFAVVSGGQIFEGFSMICCTKEIGYPELDAKLAVADTTVEGWVIRTVAADDARPLMAMNLGYGKDVSEGLFFDLQP